MSHIQTDPDLRVAIVEDHVLQRRRTEELVREKLGLEIVFSDESVPKLLAWLRSVPRSRWPQLLVLDLVVDRQAGVSAETVRQIIRAGIRVVVLSALGTPSQVRGIIRAGVSAVVGKRDSEADIVGAIEAALRGEGWMTAELASVIASDPDRPELSVQEERAMMLYAAGLTLDAVAASIGVKRDTAKKYLDRVKAKYSDAGRPIRTKVDFTRAALTDGYLDLEDLAEPSL